MTQMSHTEKRLVPRVFGKEHRVHSATHPIQTLPFNGTCIEIIIDRTRNRFNMTRARLPRLARILGRKEDRSDQIDAVKIYEPSHQTPASESLSGSAGTQSSSTLSLRLVVEAQGPLIDDCCEAVEVSVDHAPRAADVDPVTIFDELTVFSRLSMEDPLIIRVADLSPEDRAALELEVKAAKENDDEEEDRPPFVPPAYVTVKRVVSMPVEV